MCLKIALSSLNLPRLLFRMGAWIGLLACFEASVLAPASADVGREMNNFFSGTGAAANATGPSAFNGQNAGYYSMGNVWMRFPQRNVQPFNLQLPHARAGCGGIDLFAGSFSFINSAELVAMLKAVANNAVGFAFKLAIDSISPSISKTMDELAQKAQQLNQMNISSCETAQGLLKGIWPINDANRSVICEQVGNSQGLFSDWASSRQGCNNGNKRDQTIRSNNDPAMDAQLVGEPHNYTWDILQAHTSSFEGFDDDFKEMIMTVVGTIITQPSTDPTVGGTVQLIGPADDSIMQALLDGTQGPNSVPVQVLRCDDPVIHHCLNPTLVSMSVPQTAAIRPKVRQLIDNIAMDIRTNSPIGDNEKALINVASIPLYKVLAVQAAAHVSLGADELNTITEITSIDILQAMMQNILDGLTQSRTTLVKADEHTAQMWQQSLTEARQRIANRGVAISNRVQMTMQIVDRTVMLESTLQNGLSPGMAAALKFSRGLNTQGIVQ